MMRFGNMAGWGMDFWWIVGLVILGLVVWLIAAALRRSAHDSFRRESPLDVLKKRYARGEISKEEFDHMSADLRY